jgi:hypothetical protein
MTSVYIYSFMYELGEGCGPAGRGCLVLFTNTFYTFVYETCKIFISVHFNHVLLLSYTEHYLPRLCSIFLYAFFAFFGGWETIPLMCQFQSAESQPLKRLYHAFPLNT